MKALFVVIIMVILGALGLLVFNSLKLQEDMAEEGLMKISSPAFPDNGLIPAKYTCDGDDINPALEIAGVPAGTLSLVLIMDDPDAPGRTWDHWVVYNITAATTVIEEGREPAGTVGENSWGKTGYGGPCPASGTHRYFFKIYALDINLDLPAGATKKGVLNASTGHILAQGELVGRYQRQ